MPSFNLDVSDKETIARLLVALVHAHGGELRLKAHDYDYLERAVFLVSDFDKEKLEIVLRCTTESGRIYIVKPEAFPHSFDDSYVGLDFGYNNPAATIFCGIKDDEVWVRELVYKSHLTNPDLIDRIKQELGQLPFEVSDHLLTAKPCLQPLDLLLVSGGIDQWVRALGLATEHVHLDEVDLAQRLADAGPGWICGDPAAVGAEPFSGQGKQERGAAAADCVCHGL